MGGKCSIHGTSLTSAGTCWLCVGQEKPFAEPVRPPCPECAALRAALEEAEIRVAALNTDRECHLAMGRALGEQVELLQRTLDETRAERDRAEADSDRFDALNNEVGRLRAEREEWTRLLAAEKLNADGYQHDFEQKALQAAELREERDAARSEAEAARALLREWRTTPFFETRAEWDAWVADFGTRVDSHLKGGA